MPVPLLWDIPTMLVVVGGGYWLVHLHHQRKTSKALRTSRGFFSHPKSAFPIPRPSPRRARHWA
jgi:hypothetical protein